MTRRAVTAHPEQPFVEPIPIFSDDGFRYLAIVDENRHMVGIVTPSDLIAALYRAKLEEQAPQTPRPRLSA